jgi:membrane-associated phospholipid phosphatase
MERTPRRGLGLALALALLVGSPLSGQTVVADLPAGSPDGSPNVAPPPAPRDDGRRTIGRLPMNLARGAIGMFHADNAVPFIAGEAATGIATAFDAEARHPSSSAFDWSSSLETGAGPIYSTIFVAGMFTAGRIAHRPRFRAMTYDMLDAAIVNFAYTEVLKVAVGRARPNGQDNKSFPSGHTSNAFALAAVSERHYGWKVGVPAYLAAGLVGASRVDVDKHWLSDVVAGATLGYLTGRTVVRVNGRPLDRAARGPAWSLSPIVARQAGGLQLGVVF